MDKAEQILNGAIPEFLKHGYSCTSMDRIAKAAGVSKQTLYSHFSDKDGLFTALVERIACEKFQMVWAHPLEGPPDQVLRELAKRILMENIDDEDYLGFCRLIIAESHKRPDLAHVFLRNLIQPAIEILTTYLKDCPQLKIADPEATARIFVGALIHFILIQRGLHGQSLMPMDTSRLVESLVQMIVNGGTELKRGTEPSPNPHYPVI
ncbi:MAG: TetR/AcrR family transcriptional regulator [Oscillatoriales cyanobacterium RM2_1_1]|nr:TetR/AcrR family transcriptional regulator [Oscillatoriales cyanobacterium SM2_3_0]NJO44753.1 TetR/AcrR family transcriptional regulator [Oscillatoriales cyanobacterium RM2_1_1]